MAKLPASLSAAILIFLLPNMISYLYSPYMNLSLLYLEDYEREFDESPGMLTAEDYAILDGSDLTIEPLGDYVLDEKEEDEEGEEETDLFTEEKQTPNNHPKPTTRIAKNKLYKCGDKVPDPDKRLEFIHVPKAGGSFIEHIAVKHNASWGACHYLKKFNQGKSFCPPTKRLERKDIWTETSGWHAPLGNRPSKYWPAWAKNAAMFMVVRNPYDRMVSEYKFQRRYRRFMMVEHDHTNWTVSEWIYHHVKDVQDHPDPPFQPNMSSPVASTHYRHDGHFAPQSDFLVPNVQVLQLEHLSETLGCLLDAYGLGDWRLHFAPANTAQGSETASTLDERTRKLIGEVYHDDFVNFGYEK